MFIFILTYQKPLSEVEKYLEEHRTYLEINYKENNFIASGRQEPRTGGVIFCRAESRMFAQQILEADPFYINGIAKYDLIEFLPSMHVDGFDKFI